ncbi:MAG: TIGR01777 family oxidoreductase [Planctomycetales bacterium]|nr:TIGR01777 family oxidoreductase [Planctomycetales bacterium]
MSADQAARKVIVTGASGLVGTPLCANLQASGWRVVRAVRRPAQNDNEVMWNPQTGKIDQAGFEGATAVVHLAGENIADHKWSDSFKQKILHSRTKGTLLISETLAKLERKPETFVCASAIGYYGDRGEEVLTESSAPGGDFLADVCVQWEAACQPARDAGVRTANTRIGVVLSPHGGALAQMLLPFKLGAGGTIGSGQQYMSWIALDDLARGLQFVVENPGLSGPVNMVAPDAVTNRAYTKTLGKVLNRPTFLPVPVFALRLRFGEMVDALLLASTRVAPTALEAAGFQFEYGHLEPALRHLLDRD